MSERGCHGVPNEFATLPAHHFIVRLRTDHLSGKSVPLAQVIYGISELRCNAERACLLKCLNESCAFPAPLHHVLQRRAHHRTEKTSGTV